MFRFVDLSVRNKFLLTLAIPVIGLVLLIGRQLFGSIERQDVYTYFSNQSVYLGELSGCIDALQEEKRAAFEFTVTHPEAFRQSCDRTDSLLIELADPVDKLDSELEREQLSGGLARLRALVAEGNVESGKLLDLYEKYEKEVFDEIERVGKLALYPDTKDRLYAYLSLSHARLVLSSLQLRVEAFRLNRDSEKAKTNVLYISKQTNEFEASVGLFERDANKDLLEFLKSRCDLELSRVLNILGVAKQRGQGIGPSVFEDEWYELSGVVLDRLQEVQQRSLTQIREDNDALLSNAWLRLVLTVVALVMVIFSVTILAILLARTIRENVEGVARASEDLAIGDTRARVEVNANDEFGKLAMTFNGMIDNIRSLSRSAEAIGKGEYNTPVNVRSNHDTLGLALSRMRDNLRSAKIKDEEQSRILQEEKDKLQEANENVKILIKEIHHRVKNNLQVIVSLLRMQSVNIEDPALKDVFDQTQSRVRSMALIHEKLYQGSDLAQVDVRRYLEELFTELVQVNNVSDKVSYFVDLPSGFELDLNTMVPIGLMMNELITNSFKHAFKEQESGNVLLSIENLEDGRYKLVYSDDGSGMPEAFDPEESRTLGVVLIESLVEQLNGELEYGKNAQGKGTTVTVDFKPS